MIASLFTRTFLVNNINLSYIEDKFPIYQYTDFEEKNSPIEFYTNMRDIVLKDNTSSYNFINVTDKFLFDKVLIDYLSFIGLSDYKDYENILNHAKLYKDILVDKAHILMNIEKLNVFDDNDSKEIYPLCDITSYNNIANTDTYIQDIDKKIEFYKDIPVEYLYTIYREWKDKIDEKYIKSIYDLMVKKARSLWLYEIIYIWNRYQMYYYNSGYIKPLKLQNTIKDMLTSGKYSELKDLLDKNDYLIEEIKKTVRYDKKFDLDTSIFDMSMEDYLLYPSCKGYTDMNLFKFNNSMLKRFREKSDDK